MKVPFPAAGQWRRFAGGRFFLVPVAPSRALAILLGCLAGSVIHAATAEQIARDILGQTGLKGGIVIQLNCGHGEIAAALGESATNLFVVGLDTDAANVEQARRKLLAKNLYGRVMVEKWNGRALPFIENFANLIIAENPSPALAGEIQRVLAPQAVAMIQRQGQWEKTPKPRPVEMDEWTHYLHDATGNAVSHDTLVAPPKHFQWIGSPRWSRHHDHMASMSALVAANGRIFYIMDEGPTSSIRLPADWQLIARDAFNGAILWKRSLPSWNTHLWPLKSGPAQLPRRLVAIGDRVYAPLGFDAPLSVLDAATGEILRTDPDTKNTEEIICSGGLLLTLVNPNPSKWSSYRQLYTYVWDNTRNANSETWQWDGEKRWIVAAQADSGKVIWKKEYPVAPLTLAADADGVYFYDGQKVVRLARATGAEVWNSAALPRRPAFAVSFGPTLVIYKEVVLFAGGDRKMSALARQDGKILWQQNHPRGGHASPEDLLVVNDLAWAGAIANGSDSGLFIGRDLLTGEAKIQFEPDVKTYWFHHRCYRAKATDRYLLASRTGIEFVDFQKKQWDINHWVRGGCLYGIMPGNGLVYAPMHDCACYVESKLFGFCALAGESPTKATLPAADGQRLERGPAYAARVAGASSGAGDWPTYRHDAARSGFIKTPVAPDLRQAWQTSLGGRLSSLIVADNRVHVAAIDSHQVHALDANTGKLLWSYLAGGRVDSPPTFWQGRVLFGAADGWFYCLRARDGALMWRYLAAPADRRIMAFEQIESLWPASGSVLVVKDKMYGVAGRSMFTDGGLRLVQLDPRTGQKITATVLDDRVPKTGEDLQTRLRGLNLPAALPDILSSDGKFIYMRSQRFDLAGQRTEIAPGEATEQFGEGAHLFCPVGFLDDAWWHRSFWLYGRATASGYGSWFTSARYAPSGRIMVFDDLTVYGYGRRPEYIVNTSVLEFQIFAADRAVTEASVRPIKQAIGKMDAASPKKNGASSDWLLRAAFSRQENWAARCRWVQDYPSMQARALVLADKTLFLAGPPDQVNEKEAFKLTEDKDVQAKLNRQLEVIAGKHGSRLWAISASEGEILARYHLDALPVFDGLVSAYGRLFLATTDGRVMCLGGAGAALAKADHEPVDNKSKVQVEPPKLLQAAETKKGPAKDADFAVVNGCAAFAAGLGYRIEARGQSGLILKRLDKPLTKTASLKVQLHSLTEPKAARILRNGFLAFTDDPADNNKAVKCGVRLALKSIMIFQGPLKGAKGPTEKMELDADETLALVVEINLEKQTVAMTLKGKTLETKLDRPLKAITHVGYALENAVTEFSPVEIQGR